MSGNKPHINYTLADIERYLQGKLSPAEMHTLEKAALQDPFLADALEGYQSADLTTAKDHLDEIQRRLRSRDKDRVPVLISARPVIKWWRIAAIALIVIGAGSISLYLFNNTPATTEIVQQTLPASKDSVLAPPLADQQQKQPVASDKPTLAEKATAAARHPENTPGAENMAGKERAASTLARGELVTIRNRDSNAIATLVKPPPEYDRDDAKKIEQPLTALQGRVAGVQANPANKPAGKLMMRENTSGNRFPDQHSFTGQVIDSGGKPIPGAIVRIGNGDKYVAANDKGDFRFSLPDTVSRIEITALGFTPQQQQLLTGKQTQIVLKESDNNLSEVVVIGYGVQRRKDVSGSVTVARGKNMVELIPANGWESFTKYLSDKIDSVRTRNIGSVFNGTIEAELDLSRKGKVKEVTILSTFNTSLNELIIRSIKNGPDWLLADGKPARGKKKIIVTL
jgi:hypothetical protein